MAFFNNGIIIQDISKESIEFTKQVNLTETEFENFRKYRGLGRYYCSWPLSIEDDNLSRQLTAEANKWFDTKYPDGTLEFNFEIIPERDFCIKYVKHCIEKGIKIRILFCRTETEKPVWDFPLPLLNFLGYDYTTSEPFYSSIPEDLLDPVRTYLDHPLYKSLVQCRDKLNRFKLFDNEKDIRTYIERRNIVEESDIQWGAPGVNAQFTPPHLVEPNGDFKIIHLSEVMGEL